MPLLRPSGPRAAFPSSSLPRLPRAPLPEAPGSPSSFGYDHLRAHFVEFQPQLSFMEKHLDPFHALEEGGKKVTWTSLRLVALRSPNFPPKTQRLLLLPTGACGLSGWNCPQLRSRLGRGAAAAITQESPNTLHSGAVP